MIKPLHILAWFVAPLALWGLAAVGIAEVVAHPLRAAVVIVLSIVFIQQLIFARGPRSRKVSNDRAA